MVNLTAPYLEEHFVSEESLTLKLDDTYLVILVIRWLSS